MGLSYREDPDLAFLKYAEESDLETLCSILTRDKDGPRLTAEITENEQYTSLAGQPDQHRRCWQMIAAELQHFGADTLISMFRGSGVLYGEIARDVAGKLSVKHDSDNTTHEIEELILQKIIVDAWEKMSDEEKRALASELGLDVRAGVLSLAVMQAAFRAGGFASYKMALIVANSVAKAVLGKGLTFAANQALTRSLAILAGPIGWALTVVLTVPMLTGPAYRVTTPAVIQVAYMRRALAEKKRF